MSEPPDCNVFTDLRSHPEIAAQVGYYTASFAAMEVMLWFVYGFVLKSTEAGAQAALGAVQSFSAKLDVIERLFEFQQTRDQLDDEAKLFRLIFKGARDVNTFRNILAHGQYLTDAADKELWLSAYLTDPSRKKRPAYQLTKEFMESKASEVGRLHNHCLALVRLKRPEIVTTSLERMP
jgi:hypothetical protein